MAARTRHADALGRMADEMKQMRDNKEMHEKLDAIVMEVHDAGKQPRRCMQMRG